MKNLMIISFLLLGSCSVSIDKPEKISRYSFPTEWQGYYTRVSGDGDLPKEFKVSDKYMSYKDISKYAEHNEFKTYQIETVGKNIEEMFSFVPKNAYGDLELIPTSYAFEEATGRIKVTKIERFFVIPLINIATYTKSDTAP